MKKQLFTLTLACIFSAICFGQAQKTKVPAWISDRGYWQIESNIKTPKTSTIYFFNNNHEIVYQEKIEGMKINVKKRKTLMRLKQVLDQAVVAWERGQKTSDTVLLVTAF